MIYLVTIHPVSLTPLLIGFFWRLPEIEISQWTETCDDYDIPYLLSVIVIWGSGFAGLSALGGELSFSGGKLVGAYGSSILTCSLILMIPIITVATIKSDCTDWYDGFLAKGYGDIWRPLYWMVLCSSLFFSMMYAVFWTAVGARFVWAMAQPDLLVMEDGSLILDEEESQSLIESGDAAIVRQIRIGILPGIFGRTWKRTGAPIGGVVYIVVTAAVLCAFIDFEVTCIIGTYVYIVTYFFVVFAFMVMRYYEPDADPPYKVPYGKAGAWTLTVIVVSVMGSIAVYMAVELYWNSALVLLGANVLFILYYFTIKQWLDRRAEESDEQMEPLLDDVPEEVVA